MDPLDEFIDDAEDLIDAMAKNALALHAQWQNGRKRRGLIAEMFRNAHTLKGSAAAVELDEITQLTQELENLLDAFRSGRATLDDTVLDTVSDTVTTIFEMVGAVGCDERLPVPEELVARLREHAQVDLDGKQTSGNDTFSKFPDEIKSTLSESEQHKLLEAMSEGAKAFTIEINFDLATFDTQFKELSAILAECGEIISTQPGAGPSLPDRISFRIVYVTQSTTSELTKLLANFAPSNLNELIEPTAKVKHSTAGQSTDVSEPVSNRRSRSSKSKGVVRVDLSELDEVLREAQSIFDETVEAFDSVEAFNQSNGTEKARFKRRAQELKERYQELERRLFDMRTVSVVRIFSRAIRAGNAAARATGKEVDFKIAGGEIRIDTSLSDVIGDSLIHLLRNAVDHGIESPSERASLGKPVRGCIKLEALIDNNKLYLKIIDDGRGIDRVRIGAVARERGITQGQIDLFDEETLRLIFAPGFSTTEAVSELSGRGVGLDVVKTAIDQLGGKVHVNSEGGAGTTFELIVPISEHESVSEAD